MSYEDDITDSEKDNFNNVVQEIYWAVEHGDMKKAREILWKEILEWR